MIDMTAIETTAGRTMLVELDTEREIVSFLDEADRPIAAYRLATLATLTSGLAVDLAARIYLSDVAIAQLKQWARI